LSWSPTLFAGKVPEWTYAFGLQNLWMAARQDYGAVWLAATWSLAIEEQFYLLFPVVVLFVSLRTLPKVLIAIMVVCPIGRAIAGMSGDHYGYYVLMPLRADILAVGALIAWGEYSGRIDDKLRAGVRKALIASTSLLPLFVFAISRNSDFHMAVWGHAYLVIFYGAVLFMVLQMRGSQHLSILRSRVMGFFAKISYALYLVHVNVWVLVCLVLGVSRDLYPWNGVALAVLSFTLSVAICEFSWRCFEGPLQRMGHSIFTYGSRRMPMPSVAPAG
jgi:peptidoglycan/LPS O-acetylase OafA/YrhL